MALLGLFAFPGQGFAGSKSRIQYLSELPGGRHYGLPLVITLNDIAAASATAFDSGQAISTTTLVGGTTTLTLAAGDYTDIIQPRNVVAIVDFAVGAATTSATGTLVITGINSIGTTTTETLTVSTNSATGNVAWRSITSCAWTITSVSGRVDSDDALLKLGSGTKIGLPVDIIDTDDVKKCIEAGSLTTTATLNAAYNTITFVNAPDGSKDYQLWIDNR